MNRIFKTVWNRVRRCYVAVNETVTGAAQSTGKTLCTTSLVLTVGLMTSLAQNEAIAGRIYGGTVDGPWSYTAHDYIALGKHGMGLTITATGNAVITTNANMWHAESDVFYNSGILTVNGNGSHTMADWGYNAVENYGGATYNSNINYMSMEGGNSWIKNWGTTNMNSNTFVNRSNANVMNYAGGTFNVAKNFINESGGKIVNQGTFNNRGTTTIRSNGSLNNTGRFVSTGRLNLDNTGSITNSGYLSVTNMGWQHGGHYTSNGGTFNTPLNNVAYTTRDRQSMNVVNIGSTAAAKTYSSDIWSNLAAGLNQVFRDNSTINGGSKIEITTALHNDEATVIRDVIRSRFPNATVTFTNIVAGADSNFSKNHAFDAELINALIAGGNRDYTYYDRDWNTNITVGTEGTESELIKGNIGFRKVNGSAQVFDGYTLELVGAQDPNLNLATSAIVTAKGKLNLGTLSTSFGNGTKGTLPSINNIGTLTANNGTFTIQDYRGSGTVKTSDKGNLIWNNFTDSASSRFINRGAMTFTQDLNLAGTIDNSQGVVTIDKSLAFQGSAIFRNNDGQLNTAFGNIFDNGTGKELDGLHTISRQAVVPEDIQETLTALFTKYVPGSVKEDVLAHMTFNGAGKVVITNANLTTTQRDDLVKAFKEKLIRSSDHKSALNQSIFAVI